MKMKLTLRVPHWLLPKRLKHLERRAEMTGKAQETKRYWCGIIEVSTTVELPSDPHNR